MLMRTEWDDCKFPCKLTIANLWLSCLCRIQVSLANLKPVNPVPACQVTPISQGGSSEQYATDQGKVTSESGLGLRWAKCSKVSDSLQTAAF